MHIVWEFSFAATSSIPRIKSVLLGRKKKCRYIYFYQRARVCACMCRMCSAKIGERGLINIRGEQ